MASNDPVGTVQRMFTAFRGGDLDAVLDTILESQRPVRVIRFPPNACGSRRSCRCSHALRNAAWAASSAPA